MNLSSTFVEGFEAVRQPCTLPLLLSAFVFALAAGRAAPTAVLAHMVAAAFMAWARFARIWTLEVTGVTAVMAGLVVVAGIVAVAKARPDDRVVVAMGAGAGGAVAAAAWRPCVGERLADVVNDAPAHRLATLPPTLAYIAGIGMLALALAAVPVAFPRVAEVVDRVYVAGVGAALGVVLGTLMAVGAWDGFVDELLRRSTP